MLPILTYNPDDGLQEYRAALAACLNGLATGHIGFCDMCDGEGRCHCMFCFPKNQQCPYCCGIGLRALPNYVEKKYPALTTVMAIAAKSNDAYKLWRMRTNEQKSD